MAFGDWTTDVLLNVLATDSNHTLTKDGGSDGTWGDAQATSVESYATTAYLSFHNSVSDGSGGIMIGLNSDPVTDASYTSLDYCFEIADTIYNIYESGSQPGGWSPNQSFSPGDLFEIVYDGMTVVYKVAGTVVHETSRAVGAPLFLDSSFYNNGNQAIDVMFAGTTLAGGGGVNKSRIFTGY